MSEVGKVGFREGLLGESRWRLPVWYRGEESYVVEKPAGVPGVGAGSLTAGLRQQIGEGKPELERLGILGAWPVFVTEEALHGLGWFAQGELAAEGLRNLFGSRQGCFGYHLAARDGGDVQRNRKGVAATPGAEELPAGVDFVCDLPLAFDRESGTMRVSHRSGKKSLTGFRRLGEFGGGYGVWEAVVRFPRTDQVLVHALECGILIPGEGRYGSEPTLRFNEGGSRLRGRVLYSGPATEMRWLSWLGKEGEIRVETRGSKAWSVAAKRLG